MIGRLLYAIAVAYMSWIAAPSASLQQTAAQERRLLYVAVPGVRNYLEHGGIGILVFDIDHGHRFVKRIPTYAAHAGEAPEAIKGIAASATTGRLYVTTTKRVAALDLKTDRLLWNREYDGGTRSPGGWVRSAMSSGPLPSTAHRPCAS
jgi:hypothetical protein